MGFFFDKDSLFRFPQIRGFYALASGIAFVATEVGRHIYRPYVRAQGIDDFGIANTVGNSLGVITQIFFMMAILNPNRRQGYRIVVFIMCGFIAYEVIQPFLPRGVFDPEDIVATVLGSVVAATVFTLMHRIVDAEDLP